MPSRPVFHPEFGLFFSRLREEKGWTQRQAEDIAERRKLKALTRQVLWRLEKGKTKNIEPNVLRAVANLYQMSYSELVKQWTAKRYDIPITNLSDLISHEDELQQASTLRGAYETAQARVVELEREVQEREALLRDVQDVASRLVVLVAGPKGSTARTRARTGRGGHRKTG
jgi:transcriptional regulator with XRE-family HTH domain